MMSLEPADPPAVVDAVHEPEQEQEHDHHYVESKAPKIQNTISANPTDHIAQVFSQSTSSCRMILLKLRFR